MKKKRIISLICLGLVISSGIHIIKWKLDANHTKKEIKKVQEIAKIREEKEKEEEENEQNSKEKENSMNLIDVDLEKLKKINSEVRGWIQVKGTNINYPFVQTTNNTYYLTHSFDRSYNKAGWVFLDYRNNLMQDKNIILYAHGRKDKTMFGTLNYTLTKNWFEKEENHNVVLTTENEYTLWQVFSVYKITTTTDYMKTKFNGENDLGNFITMLKERSRYDFHTEISQNDKIITLSTCYDQDQRIVLHAKLIQSKNK